MKLKSIFITIITMFMMLVSCVKIEGTFENHIPTNKNGEYAILFDNGSTRTKASVNSTTGTGYDAFSLFAWNSINDTIMKPYLVEGSGISSYKYDGINQQELQYFKKVSSWYDFIGIIPTNHMMVLEDGEVKVSDLQSFVVDDNRVKQAVNLTDTLYWNSGLSVDSPEEFLWSYKRIGKENYGSTVELPFNHGNSLIFLGFSSDKTDTKLIDYAPGNPGMQAINDTTYTWYVKSGSGINPRSSSPTVVPITDEDITYINSWFSTDIGTWPTSSNAGYFTVTPKTDNIPDEYKTICETISGKKILVFDARKYLNVKHPNTSWGGNWDDDATYGKIIVHLDKPNSYHRAWALNPFQNDVETITEITPAVPAVEAIKGVRVFSTDSLGVNNLPADTLYCVHVPHTTIADATISKNGCVLNNRTTSNDVITFSLPSTTTLNEVPVWSPSTFYALPGDVGFNFIVVKLSYIYNGVTTYDVRVPIHLPDGGLAPGKYYKYELYITSTSNGTNDPDEARDEKNEVLIENNSVIQVKLISTGYTQGDDRRFTI